MNAVEIYEKASWDLEHSKITLGEFEERIKALYDVEPVRHGYWDNDMECSICGCLAPVSHVTGEEYAYEYCPNCGAKMDKGVAHRKGKGAIV